MLSSLNLTWFLNKEFSLNCGDKVANPVMGEMIIRNDWDKDVAITHQKDTTITSFGVRLISEKERKLGMPMQRSFALCVPDIDILISMQNMEVVYV